MYRAILLTMIWLIFFEGKTVPPDIQPETPNDTSDCILPAPKNIHWQLWGATYAMFAWDPVPGAAYFRVKVFNSGNTMVFSRLVPALPENNAVSFNKLVVNAPYKIEVRSVCSNGVESPLSN